MLGTAGTAVFPLSVSRGKKYWTIPFTFSIFLYIVGVVSKIAVPAVPSACLQGFSDFRAVPGVVLGQGRSGPRGWPGWHLLKQQALRRWASGTPCRVRGGLGEPGGPVCSSKLCAGGLGWHPLPRQRKPGWARRPRLKQQALRRGGNLEHQPSIERVMRWAGR